MASCLYHPDDCESERTVIISELQGGENDPGSAARSGADGDRVQGASLPAPDDRLASRSADDDARRSVRLLPALLRPEQRDAGDCRRRRHRRRRCGASSITSAAIQPGPAPERLRTVEPEQTGERRLTIRKEGTTAYLKVGYHAPVGDRSALLPAADSRCRADRREGAEPVVQLPRRRRRSAARGSIARSSSAVSRRACPAR